MGMDSTFHSGRLYCFGLEDGQGSSILEDWYRSPVGIAMQDSDVGFYLRFDPPRIPASGAPEAADLVGGEASGSLKFFTDQPYTDELRQTTANAVAVLVDEVLAIGEPVAGALSCDEGYIVGYWRDGEGVVNTTIGRLGYSLREPLTTMLLDRLDNAGVSVTRADLGDLPGGNSTAGEA